MCMGEKKACREKGRMRKSDMHDKESQWSQQVICYENFSIYMHTPVDGCCIIFRARRCLQFNVFCVST